MTHPNVQVQITCKYYTNTNANTNSCALTTKIPIKIQSSVILEPPDLPDDYQEDWSHL